MMAAWGGTTTADRDDWLDIIATGKKEGWFKVFYGNVEEHERTGLDASSPGFRARRATRRISNSSRTTSSTAPA